MHPTPEVLCDKRCTCTIDPTSTHITFRVCKAVDPIISRQNMRAYN